MDRLTIVAWNINGIRAQRGTTLKQTLDSLQADIICLQETKVTRDQIDEQTAIVDGYSSYFSYSKARSGYSGVATYVRDLVTPAKAETGLTGRLIDSSQADQLIGCYGNLLELFTEEELLALDNEGRCIMTEHSIRVCGETRCLVVINVYCPRADPDKPERLTYKLRFYDLLQVRAQELINSGRHVVILGDLNTAHKKIDHCDPEDDEEFSFNRGRQWMDRVIIELDLSQLRASPIKVFKSSSLLETTAHNNEDVINSSQNNKLVDSQKMDTNVSDISNQNTCSPEKSHAVDTSNVTTCSPLISQTMNSPTTTTLYDISPTLSPLKNTSNPSTDGLLVDTFRALHPARTGAYTNWCTVTGARATNYGRRLDYILADPRLVMVSLNKAEIRPEVQGSDHCPVLASFLCSPIPAKKCPSLCTKYLPEFTGRQQKLSCFMRVLKRVDNGEIGCGVSMGNGSSYTEVENEVKDEISKPIDHISDINHSIPSSVSNVSKPISKAYMPDEHISDKNHSVLSGVNNKLSITSNTSKSMTKTLGKRSSSDTSKMSKRLKSERSGKQQGSLLNFFTKKSTTSVIGSGDDIGPGSRDDTCSKNSVNDRFLVDECNNCDKTGEKFDNKSGKQCETVVLCDEKCNSMCDNEQNFMSDYKNDKECDRKHDGIGTTCNNTSSTHGCDTAVGNHVNMMNITDLTSISSSKDDVRSNVLCNDFSDSKESISYSTDNSTTNGKMQKSVIDSSVANNPSCVQASRSWKEMLKGPPQASLCKGHKEPCVLREVKKEGPNKGKKFWVCCKPQGLKTDPAARCDHFEWIPNK